MTQYLKKNLAKDLYGAYVHGSLGTYEKIAYSDFDALVILRSEVFQSRNRLVSVAKKLSKAKSIMFDFDPLQHHGWFAFAEANFQDYPDHYFPHTLFKHAKSLLGKGESLLDLSISNSQADMKRPFENLVDKLIRQTQNKLYPSNVYKLKGLLSEFMLLPTLYLQAKNGKGIFKKQSFPLAKLDFDQKHWEIMQEVSAMRLQWNYPLSPFKRRIMSSPSHLRTHYVKNFAPKIPSEIMVKLTPEFFSRMNKLAVLMKEKINTCNL